MKFRATFLVLPISLLLLSVETSANIPNNTIDSTAVKSPVKTGYGFGFLPTAAFDPEKSIGGSLQLNLNNYGDGSIYPNPFSTLYASGCYYNSGVWNLILSYDNRKLIPGVRFNAATQYCDERAYNFCGFNGYQSNYDSKEIVFDEGEFSHGNGVGNFYKFYRRFCTVKADFMGKIVPHLSWVAGYHFYWIGIQDERNPKGMGGAYDSDQYLYRLYNKWGIIPDEQIGGGRGSELRLGLLYDTRDSESDTHSGQFLEGHVIASPKWLGSSQSYYRFGLSWRFFVPILPDLIWGNRITYEGFMGSSAALQNAPWYMMPFYTVAGISFDRDGIGGSKTVRGISQSRVQGLQTAFFNTELRWKFWNFHLWKQNIGLCLNAFMDGGKTVKGYDMSLGSHGEVTASAAELDLYKLYVSSDYDSLHLSAGAGLRFIFNRNFIITLEFAKALNATDHRWLNQCQDSGANKLSFYFNTGFAF